MKFLARTVSEEKYLDALAELIRRYNQVGITSITERNSDVAGYRAYQALRAQGRLPARVIVTFGLENILRTTGPAAEIEQAIRALPFGPNEGDDWLHTGPLKVHADGGVLYGTAFLREPYGPNALKLLGLSDPNDRGRMIIPGENMRTIIETGNRLGWQMASHVTGDAGVDVVMDAVEAANAQLPITQRRYNLIHAYFVDDATAQRAKRLGMGIDTQPAWYYRDGDALADALGAARMAKFIAVKTWLRAGLKVAINSDHMMGFDPNTSANPYNPFLAMQTVITRKTQGGQVFGPEQRVTREEALRMTTIDAAWLSFNENRKGSIEVGKLGDLVILTDDFMTCPEDRIMDIRAHVTVVGGKVVYEDPLTL
jgi:predicted amidohydrolase YtcJ